jgi:hypothetical protein
MTDDERDQSISVLAQVTFEVQIWVAALKEILIGRGLTTDEEFARYVAAAEKSKGMNWDDFGDSNLRPDADGSKQ